MATPPVPTARRTIKIPAALMKEIGHVIVVFSAIEHELNLLTYRVLRLSTPEGRLAVTRQNIRNRMDLLRALLGIGGFDVMDNWAEMSNELQDMEEIRDWVAHGVWSLDSKAPVLQITRGQWQLKGYPAKVDRKVVPAGAPVDHHTLRGVARRGAVLLRSLEKFHASVLAQQQSLPGTQQAKPHRQATPLGHHKKTGVVQAPPRQPKPSRP